jgi:hypothetical protein
MWGKKKKQKGSGAAEGVAVATEGGCCLLELFAAVSCLVGVALIPLLMR